VRWLSKNISELTSLEFDLVIIGSGYGGSIVAARVAELLEKDKSHYRIAILEKGKEYVPGEFPTDLADIPKHVRIDRENQSNCIGDPDALINIVSSDQVTAIVGQALGGTSQLNANVAVQASRESLAGWADDLSKEYARVEHMLIPASFDSAPAQFSKKDEAFLKLFPKATKAKIAVHHCDTPDASPGNGIAAYACVGCGNCVTGCNYGAKNTLTQTYLPVAKNLGVEIYTGAAVSRIFRYSSDIENQETTGTSNDFEWAIELYPSQFEKSPTINQKRSLKAKMVVLAAGSLGSTELLLRSRADSRRPAVREANKPKSDEPVGLELSPMLGRRVSGNGDGIGFSYWEKNAVGGFGQPSFELPKNHAEQPGAHVATTNVPGPTITSMAHLNESELGRKILVQNGVTPGAIGELIAEFLTTAAMTSDLASKGWHAKRRGATGDPTSVYPEAKSNTQVILTMGDDGAPFQIKLGYQDGFDKQGRKRVIDKEAVFVRAFIGGEEAKPGYHEAVDTQLRLEIERNKDGLYVSNPLLNPIDNKLSKLLSGAKPGGGVVTVHPLGGCGMALSALAGVVDKSFRVFKWKADDQEVQGQEMNRTETYETLFVCDGSVFPKPVGVNPYLTIAALAEKLAPIVHAALKKTKPPQAPFQKSIAVLKPRPIIEIYRADSTPTEIKFNERLRASLAEPGVFDARESIAFDEVVVTKLAPLFYPSDFNFVQKMKAWLAKTYVLDKSAMPNACEGLKDFRHLSIPPQLILNVSWVLPDVAKFLRGDRKLEIGKDSGFKADLSLEFDQSRVHPQSEFVIPSSLPDKDLYILEATSGEIDMFRLKSRGYCLDKIVGLWEWACLRGFQEGIDEFKQILRTAYLKLTGVKKTSSGNFSERLKDFWSRAKTTAEYAAKAATKRTFSYEFEFFSKHTKKTYRLTGKKLVTFDRHLNPLRSMGDIPNAMLKDVNSGEIVWQGLLSFDAREFARTLLPEATKLNNLPDSLLQTAKFGSFLARVLIQHNIWHFRKPEYKPFIRRAWDYPGDMVGLVREPFDITVPRGVEAPWPTPDHSSIRLTRYVNPKGRSQKNNEPIKSVLFLHGLLHSASCFSTRYIVDRVDPLNPVANLSLNTEDPQNMVEYFCARGYECWLVDMRVSTANLERKKAWTLDQVAAGDLPTAIEFVRRHIDNRTTPQQPRAKLNVFAHCMGAAVMSMAVLRNANSDNAISKSIDKLILCQFGPLLVPSDSNLARSEMVSLAKDFFAISSYNPVVDDASTRERRPLKNDEDMFTNAQSAVIFDRFAAAYPRDRRDERVHPKSVWTLPTDDSICNRLAMMIGENWVHENLSDSSHANLEEFIGPTRIETFWQTLYFGTKGRVVDYSGNNIYMDDSKLKAGFDFPVLFLHGQRNGLFHPRSTFLVMQRLRQLLSNASPGSQIQALHQNGNYAPETRFQYFLVSNYGHLENVIGEKANQKVFPKLYEFFEQ
jgi:cholesterol oxidase